MPSKRKEIIDKVEARLVASGHFQTVTRNERDYLEIEDATKVPAILIQDNGHDGEDPEQSVCALYTMSLALDWTVVSDDPATALDDCYLAVIAALKQPNRFLDELVSDLRETGLSPADDDWVEDSLAWSQQGVEIDLDHETSSQDPSA